VIRSCTCRRIGKKPPASGESPIASRLVTITADVRADALRAQILLRPSRTCTKRPTVPRKPSTRLAQVDQRDAIAELGVARGRLAALVGRLLPAARTAERARARAGSVITTPTRPRVPVHSNRLGEAPPHHRAAAALGVDAEDLVVHHDDLDQVAERNLVGALRASERGQQERRSDPERERQPERRTMYREREQAIGACVKLARIDDATRSPDRARGIARTRTREQRMRRAASASPTRSLASDGWQRPTPCSRCSASTRATSSRSLGAAAGLLDVPLRRGGRGNGPRR
jgi:hypothetical protein